MVEIDSQIIGLKDEEIYESYVVGYPATLPPPT